MFCFKNNIQRRIYPNNLLVEMVRKSLSLPIKKSIRFNSSINLLLFEYHQYLFLQKEILPVFE